MRWSSCSLGFFFSLLWFTFTEAGLFFRDEGPYVTTSSCSTSAASPAYVAPSTVSITQTIPGVASTIFSTVTQSIPTTIQNVSSITLTSFQTVSQLATIQASIISTLTLNTCTASPPIPVSPVGTVVSLSSTMMPTSSATDTECLTATSGTGVGESGAPIATSAPVPSPSSYSTQTHASGMPLGGSFLARDVAVAPNELKAKSLHDENALKQKAIEMGQFHGEFGRHGDFGRHSDFHRGFSRRHWDDDWSGPRRRWRHRRWWW